MQINRSRRGKVGWSADPDTLVLDDLDGVFRDLLLKYPKQRFYILRPDRYDPPAVQCSVRGMRHPFGPARARRQSGRARPVMGDLRGQTQLVRRRIQKVHLLSAPSRCAT